MANFNERYTEIWQTFVEEISTLSKDIIDSVSLEKEPNLHGILKSLQAVPYQQAHNLFDGLAIPTNKRPNIGSVTGVFFEIMTASIIQGYIKKHLPDATVELNSCSHTKVGGVARDPDIFIHYNGWHVVFETKTSPKRRDLEHVREQRSKYLGLKHTQYYVVGGHASMNKSLLHQLAEGQWICFTSVSERNQDELKAFPSLDELLEKSVQHIKGGQSTL